MSVLPGLIINPSTSLVLIRNLSSTKTIIYLSTLQVPDFEVTIRDVTGSANIATSSICLSTIPNAVFQDGRSQVCLNQPYANVTAVLRNSTTWEIKNSFGLAPAESAANLNTVTASTVYVAFPQAQQKLTSSLIVENLTTSTNIQIGGDYIFPAFSTLGNVTFLSGLTVKGETFFGSNLSVSGPTFFGSSLGISTLSSLKAPVSIGGSAGIGGDLFVTKSLNILDSLFTPSTFVVNTLQVQKSTVTGETAAIFQGDLDIGKRAIIGSTLFLKEEAALQRLWIQGSLSSFSDVEVNGRIQVDGQTSVGQNVSSLSNAQFGNTIVEGSLFASSLQIDGSFTVLNILSANTLGTSNITIGENLSTQTLFVSTPFFLVSSGVSTVTFTTGNTPLPNRISTGSLFVQNLLSSVGQVDIGGNVSIAGNTDLQSVQNASTLNTGGDLNIGSNLSVFTAGFVGDAIVQGSIQDAGTLTVEGNAEIGSNIFVSGNLTVNGTTTVDTSYTANAFFLNLLNLQKSDGLSLTAPYIRTSSIQTSNIVVSSLITDSPVDSVGISLTSSYTLFAQSTFARSNIVNNAIIQDLSVQGTFTVGSGAESDFTIYTDSVFTQGFSSIITSTGTATASSIKGTFVGDGSALINANVLTQNLSATTLAVGDEILANTIQVISATISSFVLREYGLIQSSLLFSTLSIYSYNGSGIPDGSNIITTTQDTSTLTLNKSIFMNRFTQNVGIFISSPQYDLDVSGIVACGSFFFSSYPQLSIVKTTMSALAILASTIVVRDLYEIIPPLPSTSPVLVLGDNANVFSFTSTNFYNSESNSIYSLMDQSRLQLRVNSLNIFGSENAVTIGSDSTYEIPATRTFQVPSSLHVFSTFASSVQVNPPLVTPRFATNFLGIFQTETGNYLHVPPGAPDTDLIVNSNFYVRNLPREIAIGLQQTGINLNVAGNSYFSSAQVVQLRASNIAYRFVNI
jgi:hypothetical protein